MSVIFHFCDDLDGAGEEKKNPPRKKSANADNKKVIMRMIPIM